MVLLNTTQAALTAILAREVFMTNTNNGYGVFKIIPARYSIWGYEIIAKNFHNIAPSIESAERYLIDRFGINVKYKVVN